MKYGEKFTRVFVTEYKKLIPFNHSSSLRQLSGIGITSFNGYTHDTRVANCFSSILHAAKDLVNFFNGTLIKGGRWWILFNSITRRTTYGNASL